MEENKTNYSFEYMQIVLGDMMKKVSDMEHYLKLKNQEPPHLSSQEMRVNSKLHTELLELLGRIEMVYGAASTALSVEQIHNLHELKLNTAIDAGTPEGKHAVKSLLKAFGNLP